MFNNDYPQLRIAGPNCNLVRDKEIDEGTWFLSYLNGDFEELTGGVRVTIDGYQMKAMDWIVNPPVVNTDKDSPCYRAIQARSRHAGEKCLWGPEYCLRINNKTPALLYLGNKSSRNLTSSIRVGGEYILLPQRRVHGEFVWYVPNVVVAGDFDNATIQSDD